MVIGLHVLVGIWVLCALYLVSLTGSFESGRSCVWLWADLSFAVASHSGRYALWCVFYYAGGRRCALCHSS